MMKGKEPLPKKTEKRGEPLLPHKGSTSLDRETPGGLVFGKNICVAAGKFRVQRALERRPG